MSPCLRDARYPGKLREMPEPRKRPHSAFGRRWRVDRFKRSSSEAIASFWVRAGRGRNNLMSDIGFRRFVPCPANAVPDSALPPQGMAFPREREANSLPPNLPCHAVSADGGVATALRRHVPYPASRISRPVPRIERQPSGTPISTRACIIS
jgi:hypothetical protein